MSMFEDKKYLTGDNGEFKIGDIFRLLEARIVGKIKVNGDDRIEAKMKVQRKGEDPFDVYTSGRAITSAIDRMVSSDLPAWVKIGTKTTPNGDAHILEQAAEPKS